MKVMKFIRLLIASALLVSLHGAYAVGNNHESLNLATWSDYLRMPTQEIVDKAHAGDPGAQYLMYELYGQGGSKNIDYQPDVAQEWMRKAIAGLVPLAEQGNAEAQFIFSLIVLTRANEDVRESFVTQLTSLVERGDVNAQATFNLFSSDRMSPVDLGLYYLTKAAEQNHVIAQELLSSAYDSGIYGIDIDDEKHQYWLKRAVPNVIKAVEEGDIFLQRIVARYYAQGVPGLIEPDAQQAQYWYEEHLKNRRGLIAQIDEIPLRHTIISLVFMYRDGEGVELNLQKSYALASLFIEYSHEPQKKIALNLQQKVEYLMSEEELESAKQLAQQCLQNLTPACY